MAVKVSVIPLQIRFKDIDSVGHVNNALYLTYFEMGRVDFIRKFLGGIRPSKSGIVIAHTEIDYLKPMFLESKCEILTKITGVGNTSFTFSHMVTDSEEEDFPFAVGKVVAVMLGPSGNKISVPDSIRELIQ